MAVNDNFIKYIGAKLTNPSNAINENVESGLSCLEKYKQTHDEVWLNKATEYFNEIKPCSKNISTLANYLKEEATLSNEGVKTNFEQKLDPCSCGSGEVFLRINDIENSSFKHFTINCDGCKAFMKGGCEILSDKDLKYETARRIKEWYSFKRSSKIEEK